MQNLIKKMFTQEELDAIVSAIGEAEKNTSGEIQISIRQKRRWSERKLNIDEIAQSEFYSLGMNKTSKKTGVLIFLLLEERKFYIFADKGIFAKVETSVWEKIAGDMSSQFLKNDFYHGIIKGIQEAGKVLSLFFPPGADDVNELPNTISVS
ncbi:MAG: TPM domain-containing protein [Bacteroidetes bacterium]|nr:TPM domain-containing protein [Bacteroidota bacterium]